MRSALTLKRKEKIRVAAGFLLSCFLFYMVKDKCFIIENLSSGKREFYDLQSEVAQMLGVSQQYVSFCKKNNLECKGYRIIGMVNMFYLVKTKQNKFEICTVQSKKRRFIPVNDRERMIPYRHVSGVKDAMGLCHNGENIELD